MRILFVTFPNSIHSVRWIHQLSDQGWDLHLVPSLLASPLDADLLGKVTFHGRNQPNPPLRQRILNVLAEWPYHRGSGHVHRLMEKIEGKHSGRGLERLIHQIQPDIVHSMEIQQGGYMTLTAKERMGKRFPTWLLSNWGSDIYLFHRIAAHQERIKRVLKTCDYFVADCNRDVKLAQTLGLKTKPLPIIPGAGGFDLERWQRFRQPGPTSKRRVILLKGYQHWAGRALAGLRAIELCADIIRAEGYRIVIPLASPDVKLAAKLLEAATGIPVEIPAHGAYSEAISRFGTARIHIGLSISDGASQSLLESLVMGAFPIQSCTACADEWIEDGKSGLIVPPEDPLTIAQALRRALTEDWLVDQSAQINDETARQRLDYTHVKAQVIDMYQIVYSASKRTRPAVISAQA